MGVINNIHGEGFYTPKQYWNLQYSRLRTIRECKDWLVENLHGWFDARGMYGRRTGHRFVRRITLQIYIGDIKFESKPLTVKKFREIVSYLIEKENDQ